MIILSRLLATLCFIVSTITLLRPRTGWGRLVLFTPKLFAGTFIPFIGALGLVAAIAGWMIAGDPLSLTFGLGAAALSSRHIYRIVKQGLRVGRNLEASESRWGDVEAGSKLSFPWIVYWKGSRDPAWDRDVQIGEHLETGHPILADLWRPSNLTPRSGLGLVYLHGSGWHYADKDFGTRHFFRHLATQGHLIADVAYTLAPGADLLGMLADVKRAIVWMKEHATELAIQRDRIVLMGGSAGGHLALLAGYTPNHHRLEPPDVVGDTAVRGVVSYYGPPDLRAQHERFKELPGLTGRTKFERLFMDYLESRFGFEVIPVHRLLPEAMGGDPAEIPELYDLLSPSSHVGEHCPPTLLLQGGHDFSGAAPAARRLHGNLLAAGCECFYLDLPDTEHGFDLYKPKWSPAAQTATYVAERFLETLI